MSIQRLIVIALCTALIAVLAQVSIPLPFSPVPFTGQVIGVLLAGALLGSKDGLLAVFAYLLLGAAGAPVFAMGRGGLFILLGPTGGYLLGFMPAAYLTGRLTETKADLSLWRTYGAMLIALVVIFLLGAIQLGLIMNFNIMQTLMAGVIPFIPLDLLKVVLAGLLYSKIRKSLHQGRLGHILNK
ncbi:MAG TPA: biotin transporter BioY [Candidatus Limnocylindrales bacterium]|nr:biotin transporter BioY [Candidatus Limnocylindrales bacterium]